MLTFMQKLCRRPEGEGDGGGGGADPASDRSAKLEQRLDALSGQLSGFLNKTQKQEADSAAMRAESVIKAAVDKGEKELNDAEAALTKAIEDGEAANIAKAQRDVAQKAARLERINAEAEQVRRDMKAKSERRSGGAGGDLDTTNLDNWKTKHASWYGVDKDMTKAAHEIDAKIREAGAIVPGTEEYFNAVDRQMSARFPDKLAGSPQTGSRSASGAPPANNGGGQRIAASVAEGYRRMGINVDDPKVAARMIANREKAVQKGFLPAQPVTGRILER
jgi:hypothetical protein